MMANNSNNNEIKQFDVRKMRNFNDILLDLETSVESKNGANDYNTVMRVMGALSGSGFPNISLVTDTE